MSLSKTFDVIGGRVSPKKIPLHKKQNLRRELLRACDCIRKSKDFTLFLDFLTEGEHIMIARRILIAKRLMTGMSIRDIRRELDVGQATIESVHRWLRVRFLEYQSVLPSLYQELKEQAQEQKRKAPIIPYSFRWIRRKYPLHSLIFNLLLDDIDWTKGKIKPPQPPSTAYSPIIGKERKTIIYTN